jgi:LysM repeat protein
VANEVQAGISPACTSFATAVEGDTCIKFAEANGIKPEQLYDWNPVLGAHGANCATSFWADTSYCIGAGSSSEPLSSSIGINSSTTAVSSTASPTASAEPPAETETQAGISPSCNSFATAIAGDTYINFAKFHSIEAAQLYEWNPILGPDGAKCATLSWAKESYCIGVGTSSASDSPGMPLSPQSVYSSGESSVSSAMYTASAPGSTLAVATPIPPSSASASISVSSEDICRLTVTLSVTQTVTETVYEMTTSGSLS